MIEKAEDGDGELLGHLMLTARKVAKEQGLEKVAVQCPFTGASRNYFECRLKAVTHCTHILVSFHLHTCILLNVLHSGIPSGHQQWSGGLPVSLPSAHSCSRRSSAQLAPWLIPTSPCWEKCYLETNFDFGCCSMALLCFCTQGLEKYFAIFLPLPLPS